MNVSVHAHLITSTNAPGLKITRAVMSRQREITSLISACYLYTNDASPAFEHYISWGHSTHTGAAEHSLRSTWLASALWDASKSLQPVQRAATLPRHRLRCRLSAYGEAHSARPHLSHA
jgi:hypothetical protein